MSWKRVVGIVAVVLVLLVLGAYFFLSIYDYNRLKPRIAKAAKDATGRELTLAGNLDVKISLSPTLTAEHISLQNASWGTRPDLATLKRLEVQIGLLPLILGRIEVKRLTLVKPDIIIETDESGKLNLEFQTPPDPKKDKQKKPPAPFKLPPLAVREVRLDNGLILYKHAKPKETYALKIDRLKASSKGFNSPLAFNLEGAYLDNPLEAEGTLGAFPALFKPDQAWPLKLALQSMKTSANLEGSIRDVMGAKGVSLAVKAYSPSIIEIGRLAGVDDLPDVGPVKLDLQVADSKPNTFKVSDIIVALADSDLAGSAEINLGRDRPKFEAELSSKNLDLRPLFAEVPNKTESKKPADKEKKRSPRIFPDDPLPVNSLNIADARIKFQGGRILLIAFALQDISLDLVLEKGRLVVDPVKSSIGGGNMVGRLEVQPQDYGVAMATTAKIENIDTSIVPQEVGISEIIDGKIKLVDIDVSSRGRSVADLMARLSGKTIIVMEESKLNNKFIDRAGKYLGGDLFRLINPVKEKGTYTTGNCLVCRLDIEKGIAKVDPLLYDTETMSVVAVGDINLRKEKLNIAFRPAPKKDKAKYSMSLGKLAEPFKLGGTLSEPSLQVDRRGATNTFVKAAGATILLGPVGLVAVLFVGETAEENPCLGALERLEETEGEPKGKKKKQKKKESMPK
jgi:uncharacterized protein involved in outer membrane biogenesis